MEGVDAMWSVLMQCGECLLVQCGGCLFVQCGGVFVGAMWRVIRKVEYSALVE